MYPFIETICIENGRALNLDYHNERLNRTRARFYPSGSSIDLQTDSPIQFQADSDSIINTQADSIIDLQTVMACPIKEGRVKCRVLYADSILEIDYAPYVIRPVSSLQIVQSDTIDYGYKSSDRKDLNTLFDLRKSADDVLIVRHGRLTDTSIANVALYDGKTWVTPQHPLLKGTKRAQLLHDELIMEKDIHLEELANYTHITLFNAMIEFKQIVLPISQIQL